MAVCRSRGLAAAAAGLRQQSGCWLLLTFIACSLLLVGPAVAGGTRQLQGFSFCSSSGPGYEQPKRGTPPAPVGMSGSRLVNKESGRQIYLRGINWFGFNVGMGMVDGLWIGGSEAATDFALITYQLRLLGYNAVRLPFTWRDLDMAPRNLVKECTPVTPEFLKNRLISPHVLDQYWSKPLPGNVSPQSKKRQGYCNEYLPRGSNYQRLLFVLQSFIAQGIYVVLDYQPMGLEQHPYDVSLFVNNWAKLWTMVACLPNFEADLANRIFVDVMNEPDSMDIRWQASGGRPGAMDLYLGTADTLWAITPGSVLFFFEGTGQNAFGLNWGNGFITDSGILSSRGLSDANPFFRELLKRPYATAAAITPHVYPPSITKATFLGTALWDQCHTAFGYLQEEGYCPDGPGGASGCTQLPVVIGETGSAFAEETDRQWLADFADYVMARGGARAFTTTPVNGWLWWAYNQNSGDTGGIVHNGWQDLDWNKINFMIAAMGLRPWYLRDP